MRSTPFSLLVRISLLVLMLAGFAWADDESMMVSGEFRVTQVFSFFPTPVGDNCFVEVSGELRFTGSLEGFATGTTRAFVFGPCSAPPGAYPDVFRSKLKFAGTLDYIPVEADITYEGITKAGGDGNIEGRFLLSNGLKGILKVDAIVLFGGSYAGFIEFDDDDD